ncbi:MAG: SUMF1/EgtB/PvdO family nonheme iron enzyme, partial [Deltaproteobacteria bacterium]|nr:SUMF1/EgtB/PvdO family nonheme iron enzyme [Deltaproteobacteria bacterium]
MIKTRFIQAVFLFLSFSCNFSCFIKEKCYSNEDCPDNMICNRKNGDCRYQCSSDNDCGQNFACIYHKCLPKSSGTLNCPPDMANVENSFCMDKYEASRPDATASLEGASNTYAMSREGVLPWLTRDNTEAETACRNTGKRLCTSEEWYYACSGENNNRYVYGNEYDPLICNGIDTFCDCQNTYCSGLSICPYPHCYNEKSPEGAGPCGSSFHIMPTGSFKRCVNKYGIYDLNGNVWEHTLNGSEYT